MRWLLVLLFVCFGCGDDDLAFDAGPGGDSGRPQTPAPEGCGTALEVEEFELTNAARADEGVPPLICDADLAAIARAHSADMCARDYFDHTNLEGESPGDRVTNAGHPHRGIGENIAAGNGAASATHQQWMSSPGHRRNILSTDYTRIGVGYAMCPNGFRHFWTQVFARSN